MEEAIVVKRRSEVVKGEFGGAATGKPKEVLAAGEHSRFVTCLAMRSVCVVVVSCCLWNLGSADLMSTILKWASVAPFPNPPSNQTQMFAEREGYAAETHKIVTDDGYHVQATRIFGKGNWKKPPVLLTHGLLSASDNFLLRGRGLDLPYILAELGHDVWLADWRGNCFSRGHQTLSTSNPIYWNFTYYHRAQHDLPAFIDLVLAHSPFDQLHYIGYSYGTTAMMILTSQRPEYANKIRLCIMLAPVGYKIRNMKWAVGLGMRTIRHFTAETTPAGMYELFPRSAITMTLMRGVCAFQVQICLLVMNLMFGQVHPFQEEYNKPLFDRVASGSSVLDIVYLSQLVLDGFRAFNYGPKENLRVYGQPNPPAVEVEKVTVPTAMFYSTNDNLNSEEGVIELSKRLQNVILLRKIPDSKFSHVDYMWGKGVETLVYKEVVRLISAYSDVISNQSIAFSRLPFY